MMDEHGVRGGHVPFGDRYGYVSASGETISHYYGDLVRQFFLGGAALMLIGAPFYGDAIRAEFPYEVFGALILAGLAALTNPWKRSIMTADAILSGIIMSVYQMWALNGYDSANSIAFVLREAISVLFMFAFYFSVKTVRAMVLHQIGRRATLDEFSRSPAPEELKDTDPVSKMRHAFDSGAVDDDDQTPPHRPTFWEKSG